MASHHQSNSESMFHDRCTLVFEFVPIFDFDVLVPVLALVLVLVL